MKKECLISAGIIGAAIGFVIGTNMAHKKYKETIKKEVKDAINKEVKNNAITELNVDELRKEVKKEAVNKVSDKLEEQTDKKIKEFDDRLKVMEDIDAKKLDLCKVAIAGVVSISTTLIKAHYNKNNEKLEKYIDALGNKHNELVDVCLTNFAEADNRLNALEVK